jgi:nitrate reductase gamma subunit
LPIISTTGLSESNKPAACQLLLGLSLNQVDEHYHQMKNMAKPMAIVVSPNKAIQAQHLSLVADTTQVFKSHHKN